MTEVKALDWCGNGSEVVSEPSQAQSLLVRDEEAGGTTMTSPVAHRNRSGLKIRGSSPFSFAEKSYSRETWGERDGVS